MTNHPELRACELKSCPFCGGEAFLAKPYDGRKYVGECLKCGTRRPYAVVTREQAISLWNSRTSPIIPEDVANREAAEVEIADLQSSSTSLEPVSDDALLTAIIKKLSDKIKFLHHQDTPDDAVSDDGEYIAISTNDANALITRTMKGQSK